VGHHPTRSLPWHFNVCRQRIREDGTEHSAFSPTGTDNFHQVMKFATFFDGNSFEFDHGPPDDDFLGALRAAGDLARRGKRTEALAACIAAADRKGSDLQKSHALELGAGYAGGLRNHELAEQLIARIPIPAVKKAAQMQHLLATAKAPQLIAQFAGEDINTWPFWKRGDGFAARGRAYFIANSGKEAEADLSRALEWISDASRRDDALLNLAQNRETNLKDEDGAVSKYRAIIDHQAQLGTATQFYAVHGIANIQSKRGRHDDALATLKLVNHEKVGGFWRDQFRLWNAETLQAAARTNDALAAYHQIANDNAADPRLRKVAQGRLAALSKEG
jgi:tetratricopeptide (TPR) repeat protein